jgi:tRNA nucleotidyltransferase/poly(A) polymerase
MRFSSLIITMLLFASLTKARGFHQANKLEGAFQVQVSQRQQQQHQQGLLLSIPEKRNQLLLRLHATDSRQLRFFGNSMTFPEIIAAGKTFAPFAMAAAGVAADAVKDGSPNKIMYFSSSSSSSSPASLCGSPLQDNFNINNNGFEPKRGYGPYLHLTPEEIDLFRLLRQARQETNLNTTLRVAGGWVRDKLLATREFSRPAISSNNNNQAGAPPPSPQISKRLTSKFQHKSSSGGKSSTQTIITYQQQPSMGRQGTKVISNNNMTPVDIDIALDDMLGREFADHLNAYLTQVGEETISVGVVMKNPEKSKHLETATMKVGTFWIDFVNLRAEQYAQDSRIPDLMRIGTPAEDAFRRDLTINSLFYNINNGQVEDWTGRGFDDLRRGVVSTPLAPLTTLLDDPLRALRSVRFAARLRFTMDEALVEAAMDDRVRKALAEKVSRERVGCEVDLMLRSPDPVGAMRLLVNLNLVNTVFPVERCFAKDTVDASIFDIGLELLTTTHDHLCDCQISPPMWCAAKQTYATHGVDETTLMKDEEARRFLWYASFLKPIYDHALELPQNKKNVRKGKMASRSVICKLLVDELKRPSRDADAVEKIMKAANEFTLLLDSGCDLSALSILLSDIRVMTDEATDKESGDDWPKLTCTMNGQRVFSASEDDPLWKHAMEFRLLCSKMLRRIGPLWRAALFLSLSEQLSQIGHGEFEYAIEGDFVSFSLFGNISFVCCICRYLTQLASSL